MKKLYLLLGVLALVAILPAQNGTGIAGVVTNAVTGEPIAGANVCAHPRGGMAVTHPDGAYLMDRMMPGDYIVDAGARGFRPAVYPDTVVVVQGEITPDINFALEPESVPPPPPPPPPPPGAGSISGHVEDAVTGEPIARAIVGICGGCEHHHGEPGGFAFTDSLGDYQIGHLAAGGYVVGARAWGYEGAFYPETVVVVDSQVTPNIDFALQPEVPHSGGIAGRVTDSAGNLIPRVVVSATSGRFHQMVLQGRNGYRLDHLPAGNYWVAGFAEGYEPGNYPDSVAVIVGQITEGIDFSLVAGAPEFGGIAGVVTDAQTQEPIVFALVSTGGRHGGHGVTDSLGAYEINHLRPGFYAVQAFARGYAPAVLESVEVIAGQVTPDVNFALEPEPNPGFGAIAGLVSDSATGYAVPGACIFVWGRIGQGRGMTDSSGSYVIGHLAAGSYVVRAAARGYYPATYPETLTVAVGETLPHIDFVLTPVRSLNAGFAGFVFDGVSQTEVSGARVTAIGEQGSCEASSNARGDYVFDNLTTGDYVLQIEANGYTSEFSFNPVSVVQAELSGLTSPAFSPLNGIAAPPVDQTPVSLGLAVRPNPVHGTASISYSVPRTGSASLKLYDVSGKLVSTLAQGDVLAGNHTARIDAAYLARGIYVLKLTSNGSAATRKLVIR
jgi:hypothetical protein